VLERPDIADANVAEPTLESPEALDRGHVCRHGPVHVRAVFPLDNVKGPFVEDDSSLTIRGVIESGNPIPSIRGELDRRGFQKQILAVRNIVENETDLLGIEGEKVRVFAPALISTRKEEHIPRRQFGGLEVAFYCKALLHIERLDGQLAVCRAAVNGLASRTFISNVRPLEAPETGRPWSRSDLGGVFRICGNGDCGESGGKQYGPNRCPHGIPFHLEPLVPDCRKDTPARLSWQGAAMPGNAILLSFAGLTPVAWGKVPDGAANAAERSYLRLADILAGVLAVSMAAAQVGRFTLDMVSHAC